MGLLKKILSFLTVVVLVSCGGGGGGSSEPTPPPLPRASVNLSAEPLSVLNGNDTTLTWSTANATTCNASGAWSGSKATSGSEDVTITLTGDNQFTLTCTGPGGSGSDSVIVEGYENASGFVVDGYIVGADVFIDQDGNFISDNLDETTQSDSSGNFIIKKTSGDYVSIGGTDFDTQNPLDNLLLWHKTFQEFDPKAITPVTSVASFLADPTSINDMLGLATDINVFTFDPVANKGDDGPNDFLYEKGNQLTTIALTLQNSINEVNSAADTSENIFLSIANVLESNFAESNDIINIESFDFLDAVMTDLQNNQSINIGDESRNKPTINHSRHIELGYLSHNKVLDYLSKSEIAVIPSRWEEPFGRTALEASSRGCATIISNTGGLPETTDYAIKLKKLDTKNIENEIIKLIRNDKLRKRIQIKSKNFVKHKLKINSQKIDLMRNSLFPFKKININGNKLRIINIYNLAQKLNHRIYNLSLGKKFTNGFIRNGHDVIEISDRDYVRQNKGINLLSFKDKFHSYLIETFKNYNPDLVIFGHSDNINHEILSDFRSINKKIIISQWNEDPLMKNLSDTSENVNKLKKFFPMVDHSFITTNPSVLKPSKRFNQNIHFFMTPVDKNIECFDVFKLKPENDVFYAMSHGVNRATLKEGKTDDRVNFLKKLI